jgi:hypothetical protein
VYAGHAALALLAKAARPRLSLLLLVPVAFAPDWIAWILEAFGNSNREISHSLVSVGIGATVVGGSYWLVTRATSEALVLWLTYASHWPADFITGMKPTWPGGPTVGLGLYSHPGWDALVEGAVIVACWLAYRRTVPPVSRNRATIGLWVPIGLVGMQLTFDAILSPLRAALVTEFSSAGRMRLAKPRSQSLTERLMANDSGPRGLVTLVCLTCGNEKSYDKAVPNAVTCDKCGGTVFRNFATPTEPDDASIAQLEEQARSISYGDSSPDTTPGDVRDLDMR